MRKWFATLIICGVTPAIGACGTGAPVTRPKGRPIAARSTQAVPTFPKLPPSAPCPRTPGGHATRTTIITLGDGPVYPIMGFSVAPPAASGVVDYQGEGNGGRHAGGFWGTKVLFAVPHPDGSGAITVEGKQIDGPNPIDWLVENNQPVGKLELPAGGQWYPTEALLKGAGCYALRIEGPRFSRLVVFKAVDDREYRQLTRRNHGVG